MKIEDDGNLILHEHDLLPRYRDRRDSPIELRAEHFTREARTAAYYAAGAGQRYRVRFVGHGRDVDVYKGEWTLEAASLDLDQSEPAQWADDPFKRLDAIGLDPDHPSHAVARGAIERKIAEAGEGKKASEPSHRDQVLSKLLTVRQRAKSGDQSGWLDDLEFLLDLAVTDYDMPSWAIASNVRELVEGDGFEAYLPAAPRPARRPRPAPLGPMVVVDEYQCELNQEISAEVTRFPDQEDTGEPACPICEREMVRVHQRLRLAAKAAGQPAVRWSHAAQLAGAR